MRFIHCELNAAGVPADVRMRAEGAALIAASLLGLPRLTVKYHGVLPSSDATVQGDVLMEQLGRALGVLGPSDYEVDPDSSLDTETWLDDAPLLGLARRDESTVIHVLPFADPFTLVKTVAHECRHRWQYAHWDEWREKRRAEWEANADAWAEAHYLEIAAHLEAAYQAAQAGLEGRR